jgi:uncharacterized protein (TIGR00299 family) protein
MLLGALLDAGASLDSVLGELSRLELPGWTLRTEQVSRAGIAATRAVVEVHDDEASRPYGAIVELVERAALPERITARSLAAFAALAEVEAAIHQTSLEAVHLHELGGHDALIDVVGTMAALEDLGVDELYVSPIALGAGQVKSAHGSLPNPAPATVALLEGFAVYGTEHPIELATPTGAAIIRALASPAKPLPPTTILSQGFGAGTRQLPGQANVVGVILGRCAGTKVEMLALLETTVDDVSGEQLSRALSALVEHGALDAWAAPVTMKKGRQGYLLSVLSNPLAIDAMTEELMRSTGSLGVRASLIERTALERQMVEVSVLGRPVRIKVSAVRAKPEFEDLATLAEQSGKSVFELEALALAAFHQAQAD